MKALANSSCPELLTLFLLNAHPSKISNFTCDKLVDFIVSPRYLPECKNSQQIVNLIFKKIPVWKNAFENEIRQAERDKHFDWHDPT